MRNEKTWWMSLLLAAALVMFLGASAWGEWAFQASCTHRTRCETQVVLPGTADEIAATLPEGTPCRAQATVGDGWRTIEYMLLGRTCTGMVRTGVLVPVNGGS